MFNRTYRSYRVFTRWTLGVLKGVTGASGGAVREAIAKQTQRTGIQLSIETTAAHDWPPRLAHEVLRVPISENHYL